MTNAVKSNKNTNNLFQVVAAIFDCFLYNGHSYNATCSDKGITLYMYNGLVSLKLAMMNFFYENNPLL